MPKINFKDEVQIPVKSSKKLPRVSVILTSFNHEPYIAAAIESVLSQTFKNFELLIVDDGSKDKSQEIIKRFKDPRIKKFLYKENRGPLLAINEAINSARGEYIAVHHSDDLWSTDKLEKQVHFLDSNKKYAACFTWVDFVDSDGKIQSLAENDFYKNIFDQPNRTRAEWLNYFFYNSNCLCHPSVLLHREVYQRFHLLNVHGFWQLPDYLMWIRLCFNAEIFILSERLTKFRLRRDRQENISATTFDKLVRAEVEFYFIAREFATSFNSDNFFLEVFPEAERFLVGGLINRDFALANLFLMKESPPFRIIGLEILKNLLSNPIASAQVKKLYNYDEKTFFQESGNYDLFNLASKLSVPQASVYAEDNQEFRLTTKKFLNVDKTNSFFVKFEFELTHITNSLRFDPDSNFISIKIDSVSINQKSYDIFSDNSNEIVNGYRRFYTNDPQIIFATENLSGHINFEIIGKIEPLFFQSIVAQTFKKNDKRIETLNYQNDLLIEQNKNLRSDLIKLNNQIANINVQNANLCAENKRITNLSNNIMSSVSWKITKPFRDFHSWMNFSNKDKFLSVGRLVYKALPISPNKKNKWKNRFFNRFSSAFKDTQLYNIWYHTQNWKKVLSEQRVKNYQFYKNSFKEEFFEQPGKIAIQAHIFYLDLLEDMASYCSNMPYKFDALISVVEETAVTKVTEVFQKISNVEKIIVHVVPNRGRDVAAFLVSFGNILLEYDFVAHIHSKKSLYSGEDRQDWRNYLFYALLGDPSRIRKIFKAFNNDNSVGVIYPRPFEVVPYAAFTWLSNREIGEKFLRQVDIPLSKTDYFDIPTGTMFWARTRALKRFFDLKLTFEDFPIEQGQNDGTIAHVFERSILLSTHAEGMIYYEFDPMFETYSIDIGSKNLWQYFERNSSEVYEFIIPYYEILSFDIFDTLIMRYVAKPYHVNEIIRLKVEELLGNTFDFPTFRIQAEAQARLIKGDKVTLDEIYKNFSELTNFDIETCQKIREIEISTEITLSLPRKEIVEWFKEAVKRGKKVWLISDMYLQTPDIKQLLKKCGIEGYEKLLISCETGMRKDTASIWNHLAEKSFNAPGKLIHIGDNEMSDVQLPGDRKFGVYHVMNGINLFSVCQFGKRMLESLDHKISLYAGISIGIILAKKFHDPFILGNKSAGGEGQLVIKTFRELGYWFYGTPLLTFILWLIKRTKEDGIRRILFLARDGYFLKPLYELVAKSLKIEVIPSDYFYASRRAMTIASIRDISQAKDLLKLKFSGTVKKFFEVRFGLEINNEEKISVPNCSEEIVAKLIDEKSNEILELAARERKNFEKYLDNVGGNFDKVGVVDMGYSGTIQFYLQKLLNKNLKGYYFATSSNNRFGINSKDSMRGCFTEDDDYQYTKSAVYQFQLLFETILTSPDAQLKNFSTEGKPVFTHPDSGQRNFKEIHEIHKGIEEFCRDLLEIFGNIVLRVPIDNNFVENWVRTFVNDSQIVAPELREIFTIEDEYCNTFQGNALKYYLEGLDRI